MIWELFLFGALITGLTGRGASSQAIWTPIYVDGNKLYCDYPQSLKLKMASKRRNMFYANKKQETTEIGKVDLWTETSKGCRCGHDAALRHECACCVKDGGCSCGAAAPHRCVQCGLQQHCTNMCNMTLDARVLLAKSGKSFGQIKSPAVGGPTSCWYRFLPQPNQRVEIQIYRLISVGRFNGTSCESGYVQMVEGLTDVARSEDVQICGSNERFSPPVVLFSDKGPTTLIFNIGEVTIRSQFLAYYSFTASNSSQGTGFQPSGGKRLDGTECDWIYQDVGCRSANSCRLATPGYPGLYPSNRKCYYHITTTSVNTGIGITFIALYLPHNHCGTDYVRVFKGATISSPVVATLCGSKKQHLLLDGPNLLIEFSSGSPVHPFDSNGFVATLEFIEKHPTASVTVATFLKTTSTNVLRDLSSEATSSCGLAFYGNESRSGHFDSRNQQWQINCSVIFIGRPYDIIHVSLFNYNLKAVSCQTVIEIYDGLAVHGAKPIKRICSPMKKHARDSTGKFQTQETFISTGNIMSILLRRLQQGAQHADPDFVDGAFLFHDEHVDGTLQPETLCDVDFYGLSSGKSGHIRNPGSQQLFWNIEAPLKCSQRFTPAANQSITIKVVSLSRLPLDSNCQTACGDGGCRCLPKESGDLSTVNHLVLTTSEGKPLSCLCGDFQQEWLPVGLRSWSPITLVYSVAQYSWTMKGFNFQADFIFHSDNTCGHQVINQHSGTIVSGPLEGGNQLNYYFHQSCTWLLDSNVERQLTLDFESIQNRPCTAWNLTIHEYNEISPERTGKLLHTFCPRFVQKNYSLPWKLNIIIIRLNAMTRMPPEFVIKWKSQIVRTNTRLAGATPAQTSRAILWKHSLIVIIPIILSLN